MPRWRLQSIHDVIEAKEAEEAKATTVNDKKRKATDPPGPAKKRGPPVRVAWNDRIAMLSKYKEDFGNLLIPIRYKLNPSLGKFVHNTREQYKLFHKKTPVSYKKKCSLTAERIQQLEDLGFVCLPSGLDRTKIGSLIDSVGSSTKEKNGVSRKHLRSRFCCLACHPCIIISILNAPCLQQLIYFCEQDCLVPHGYDADASFAEWIHRQRTAYASMEKEAKPNPSVKERMDKLEELGFNFTVHSDKWMDHWTMLKDYRDKHGHVQVPITVTTPSSVVGSLTPPKLHRKVACCQGQNCWTSYFGKSVPAGTPPAAARQLKTFSL
jgi:hypothetical protein